jgi:hypothetical protein
LKNKVAQDFFGQFDCTEVLEKIDFTVKSTGRAERYFLWAEAKAEAADIGEMLTQLILTIGKARTFDKIIPPSYLGCFDREKIAFIPYHAVQEIFYQSDFNWKITPSNKTTREFKLVHALVEKIIRHVPICTSLSPRPPRHFAAQNAPPPQEGNFGDFAAQNYNSPPVEGCPIGRGGFPQLGETYLFDFEKDEKELRHFISENFIVGKSETTKVPIDKNNFVTIYIKWLESVKPTIQIDWSKAKKSGMRPVVPPKSNRRMPWKYDKKL